MKKIKITEKQARLLETLNSKKVLKVTKEQYNRIIESELYNKPSFTETSEIREEEMNEDLFREFVNELYGMNEEGKELRFEKVCKLMEAAGLIESGKIVKEKFENNTKNVKSVIGKGLKMYEECGSAYKAVEMMEEALTDKQRSDIEGSQGMMNTELKTNVEDWLKKYSNPSVSLLASKGDYKNAWLEIRAADKIRKPISEIDELDEREDKERVHLDKDKIIKDLWEYFSIQNPLNNTQFKVGHWDDSGIISFIRNTSGTSFRKELIEAIIGQINKAIEERNPNEKLKELSDYTSEPFKTTDIKRNDTDLSKYDINPSEYGPLDEMDTVSSNVGSTAPIKPLFTEEDELSEARYKGDTYYSRGEWFSRSDDEQSLSKKTKPEWDIFVDKYNSMPGFETKTTADGRTYRAEIKNLESGLSWVVQNSGNNNWSYIGRKVGYTGNPEFLRDVQALIANFEEINGTNDNQITSKIYEALKKK